MSTNLKDINSFILNDYIDEINQFVGELNEWPIVSTNKFQD